MEPLGQNISNTAPITNQLNIANANGPIGVTPSRLNQRYKALKNEVENDERYEGFIDDLRRYNTKVDGKPTEDKLKDGGFNARDIGRALELKHQYSKKLEKNSLYLTAQLIDVEFFALIKFNFETHIEPLIDSKSDIALIKKEVADKIVDPIYRMIHHDGQDDTFLNYTVDDILGMLYYLTGKCHLNWTNYDSV